MAVEGEYKEVIGKTVCEQDMILSMFFLLYPCSVQYGNSFLLGNSALMLESFGVQGIDSSLRGSTATQLLDMDQTRRF